MTKDDYVSLEVAKKLQEKGYDEPCLAYYFQEKLINVTSQFMGSDVNTIYQESRSQMYGNVPAPTLYDAQKWLRERGYYVEVGIYDKWEWSFVIYGYDEEMCITMKYADIKYNTYEEALNAGILESLNYI